MLNTLLQQRRERDRLLAQPYLQRQTAYDFPQLLANHNVKLLTGPRRVGKSTQALLMLKEKNFAYLNFDDNSLLEKWDEDLVARLLDEVYPGYEYLLLDEVQNIHQWDVWVSKLYRRGVNMVITGSNANMLSGEMATLLTGRYFEIRMLPFSLAETYAFHGMDLRRLAPEAASEAASLRNAYLRMGGFPESVLQRALTQSYLANLFDSIVLKDVVKRHRVRHVADLNNLAEFLLANFCNPFSYNDVCAHLSLGSVTTTKKFMDYLREPFLFYYLSRYNHKLQHMKKAPQKVYVVDNGFVFARAFSVSENLGRLLENQVFVELLRRGYDTASSLFYYRSRNDKETDFVVREGVAVKQLVQVCYDLSSPKTEKREVDSLVECAEELRCENLVIVTDHEERTIEKNGHVVRVLPIWQF